MADASLPKITPFPWSAKATEAVALIADDRLSEEQIAAQVGVIRKTLYNWRRHPEFAARVAEIVEAARAEALRCGVAVKAERIRGYQDRYQRMRALLDARAAAGQRLATALQGEGDADRYLRSLFGKGEIPPGLETGLLVKTVKVVGKVTEEEWSVDTGLLSEMRATEKQAAQEMGDWTEKRDVTSGGQTIGTLADILAAARAGTGTGDAGSSPSGDSPLPAEPPPV